jgi:hypothetical protein
LIDTEDTVGTVSSAALNVFPQLEVRYSDGYKAAKAIVGFGNVVKILGAVAGIIIAGGSLVASSESAIVFFGGAVFGGLVWLVLFVGGVVVCAQGQLLLATLDSAVNNSPFLDNSQRASIMSLTAVRISEARISDGSSGQGTENSRSPYANAKPELEPPISKEEQDRLYNEWLKKKK